MVADLVLLNILHFLIVLFLITRALLIRRINWLSWWLHWLSHWVERRTRDREVADLTPGRGAIKSTRSTQPSLPLG